jgi:catechol 2,3-dioxygenase-like lactoylglutathione lyase family enzyme
MQMLRIDHVVLTVGDIATTVDWYRSVLGMLPQIYGDGRHALVFGSQKLNLHQSGREVTPNAARATPGSADLCLISAVPLPDVVEHLRSW